MVLNILFKFLERRFNAPMITTSYFVMRSVGLEEAGHQVTQLSNGIEGLKAFKSQRPDLVITNVVMDQGEGDETMKMMFELAPGTPVIAISAFQSYLQSMEILGACHSLVKPFCMPALIEAVDSVMGSQGNS